MTLKEINKKLFELYGSFAKELPNFRIVWSADQFEDRFGEFNDFYGDIFIRSFKGVRRVHKYQEDPPSFVLERLLPNQSDEIVNSKFTYEPLYFFRTDSGEQLPLEWRAIEFIMWTLLYGPRNAARRAAIGSDERKKKETAKTLEMLQEASPYVPTMLSVGEAIVNPWGKERFGGKV